MSAPEPTGAQGHIVCAVLLLIDKGESTEDIVDVTTHLLSPTDALRQYASAAFSLGLTTVAVFDDAVNLNYLPDGFEAFENFVEAGYQWRNCTTKSCANRYAISRSGVESNPKVILHRAKTRGFHLQSIKKVAKLISTWQKAIKIALNSNVMAEWEKAIQDCYILGYTSYEIAFYLAESDGKREAINEFTLNLDPIQTAIAKLHVPAATSKNYEWETADYAHNYVQKAFLFGISIKDIVEQLRTHYFGIHQINEEFIENFLQQRFIEACKRSSPPGPAELVERAEMEQGARALLRMRYS